MSGEIKIINWEDIKSNFVGKKLSQLDKVEVASASVKSPPNMSVAGVGLSFGASAKFAINAYNDAHDPDDEHVVGTPNADTPEGALDPKIPFDVQKAWLRYSFVGALTAEAKAKLQAVNVGVDASSQLVFSDYRAHKPADPAELTVAGDLVSLRTPLSLSDVLNMGPSEALYYQIRGDLAFSVKVSWADVFTKTLSEISSALPSSEAFAIEIDVSAFASFKVTLSDDFILVFWRDAANQLHAGVRKASTRGTAFALGVNVIAKFENPDDITKLAAKFLDGVLGEPLAKIDEILNAATGGTLNETQKKIFDRLVKLLGVENALDQVAEARKKLGELPEKLEAAIQKAAETQIGLSWKYEYSRVESTQCIVETALTTQQMTELHRSLVAQNLKPLLDRAKTGPGDTDPNRDITLTKYLDETTVVRTSGFAFSLGINKWFTIGAKDKKKITIRTRRSIDQKRSMVNYIGSRNFGTTTFGSVVDDYGFDFAASMDGWAEEPKAADFDFGLALTISDQDKSASENDIARMLDTASLWSIVTDEDIAGLSETLKKVHGHRITARYEIKFSEDVLRQIAGPVGTRNDQTDSQMARALAAAMPWQKDFPRSSWRRRMDLYDNAWFGRINKQFSPQQAFDVVRNDLTKNHITTEHVGNEGLLGQLTLNPEVISDYSRWTNGMALLSEAVGAGTMPHKKIDTMFGNLYNYFSRVLYARAIGRRLTEVAAAQGVLGEVGRALTITQIVDGKPQKVISIGSKA